MPGSEAPAERVSSTQEAGTPHPPTPHRCLRSSSMFTTTCPAPRTPRPKRPSGRCSKCRPRPTWMRWSWCSSTWDKQSQRWVGPLGGGRQTSPQTLLICLFLKYELPGWLSGKEPTCQCRRCEFNCWVGKIPWRRAWQRTPVLLPGESQGQRSWAGCSPLGRTESNTPEWRDNNTADLQVRMVFLVSWRLTHGAGIWRFFQSENSYLLCLGIFLK